MNKFGIITLCFLSCWMLSSCANNEPQVAENQQQAMLDGEDFEDELYIDTAQIALEDSLIEAAMQKPVVVNPEEVMKKLKPNEDDVILIDWNVLNDITLDECFNEDIGEYYWCPEFGSIMKSLEGKTVALKGYVLPLDGGYFVLSMNPMASCFFCGGSGPQSIVDLKFKGPRAFKMDSYLTFKGKLRLNSDNIEELFYVFDDADVYETEEE
ncbi:MAG: DUF3299 domain-containing protein [Saprospiraceae bacterium]